MPEMLEFANGIRVPVPEDPAARLRYSREEADLAVNFFSLLVYGQSEWAGKPFELMDWQEAMIREFFGVQVQDEDGTWVRYRRFLYQEGPKKNGKTELAAGLALKFLAADREPEPLVGVFSVDKQNSDQIYKCAKYMIEHSCLGQPEHDPLMWCRDSRREIYCKLGGMLKIFSSDAASKHGYSFSAVIIDELHAQPKADLWDILVTGSDAARRQQAVVVLTTAGDDPDRKSIAWQKHELCRRILAWRRGEPERELDRDDPQWLPVMFGLSILTGDDEDKLAAIDIYDEEIWRQCNPAYGRILSPRKFRDAARMARQSDRDERRFRWLRLNQWVSTKTVGWLPLTVYDKTQIGPSKKAEREAWVAEHLRGKRCYGGLDLSKTTDLTAFVLVFPPQPGLETWVVMFFAWRPEEGTEEAEKRDGVPYRDWARAGFLTLCPGSTVDYSMVAEFVESLAKEYELEGVGADPALGWVLLPEIQKIKKYEKDWLVEIPQRMVHMSPPTKEIERLVLNHEMLHVHNTCARWCVGNVRCVTDGNENQKMMKNKSTGRIDCAVAWAIAMAVAMMRANKPRSLGDILEAGEFSL